MHIKKGKRRLIYFLEEKVKNQGDLLSSCMRALLYIVSRCYGIGVFFHQLFWKIRKPYTSSLYTISIGNITAGGTGKTPFTLLLASLLGRYLRCGIVLRGYKGSYAEKVRKVTSEDSAAVVGDEALVFLKKAKKANVYVAKQRKYGVQRAQEDGCDVVLIDDGMQHYSIARDVNVVVLHGLHPFGGGYLLPRGYLREPLIGLQRADYIVLNYADQVHNFSALQETISKYSSAPIICVTPVIDLLVSQQQEQVIVEAIAEKVALFSGIGEPKGFFTLVEKAGFDVVAEYCLHDHEKVDEEELSCFWEQAKLKGAKYLLTTEKDAVKYNGSLPIVIVQMKYQVLQGQEHLDDMIQKVLLKTSSAKDIVGRV